MPPIWLPGVVRLHFLSAAAHAIANAVTGQPLKVTAGRTTVDLKPYELMSLCGPDSMSVVAASLMKTRGSIGCLLALPSGRWRVLIAVFQWNCSYALDRLEHRHRFLRWPCGDCDHFKTIHAQRGGLSRGEPMCRPILADRRRCQRRHRDDVHDRQFREVLQGWNGGRVVGKHARADLSDPGHDRLCGLSLSRNARHDDGPVLRDALQPPLPDLRRYAGVGIGCDRLRHRSCGHGAVFHLLLQSAGPLRSVGRMADQS